MKRGFLAAVVLAAAVSPCAVIAAGIGIMPGQWDIAVTTESMEMEGMPPGAANAMRGKAVHLQHCITPADAAKGPQEMLKSDKSCTFGRISTTGNVVHAEITCKPAGGGTMHSVSDSTYTPTGFTSHGRTVMTGQMKMTVVATTVGKRVGACTK
ncbi:DUF3617 domain-containing protein [Sphingosinicellaceae bacterium]|nr:DUF3617 domain-containing protein [Sphingosinicellaceae bacterium]